MTEDERNDKFVAGVLLLLLIGFCLGTLFSWLMMSGCQQPPQVVSDSITVTKVEIHPDSMPKQLEPEKVVGQVTVPFIPSFSMSGENKPAETILYERNHENKTGATCLFEQNCDNKHEAIDSITLDVVQRTYGDSTYTAYVSGPKVDTIGPKLDSIFVKQRNTTKIITHTITIPARKSHWHFGLQAGAGVGLTSRKVDFYVGGGVNYDF